MIQRRRLGTAGAVVLAAVVATYAQSSAPAPIASKEWPTYGHDPGGMRFSPLTQITPANVGQLQVAWVYHMKPSAPATGEAAGRGRGGAGFNSSEVTPLVINGVMYIATPYYRVAAVDSSTGNPRRGARRPMRASEGDSVEIVSNIE